MAEHKRTRTTTMSWGGLSVMDDDDDDDFFDSNNRISAVVPFDMAPDASNSSDSSDDDDAFKDPKLPIATSSSASDVAVSPPTQEYDLWLETPASISERRKRLFQGMGLNSSKNLSRLRSMDVSKKLANPVPNEEKQEKSEVHAPVREDNAHAQEKEECQAGSLSPSPVTQLLVRSRSDGDIDPFSVETKKRREKLIGDVSKQRLTRTSSTLNPCTSVGIINVTDFNEDNSNTNQRDNSISNKTNSMDKNSMSTSNRRASSYSQEHRVSRQLDAFCLIKNLDPGNDFIVKEPANDGMSKRLSDLKSGKQLSMDEFEKSVGYSPVVKELMGREDEKEREEGGSTHALEKKTGISKRFRFSKKRGASLLRSINSIVTQHLGSISENKEKEKENENHDPAPETQKKEWVRVRSQGKNYKELTALRLCQEINGAHQGSIWAVKFNSDGRFLATAGEDKVVRIWEVQECEIATAITQPDDESANSTPPSQESDVFTLDTKRVKSATRRPSGSFDLMPDYVRLPESLFALSDEPFCSFEGHLDDVLDLSWSTSQVDS